MLSISSVCGRSPASSGYSQADQWASSRRQAVPTRTIAIHNSQFTIQNSRTYDLPHTNYLYLQQHTRIICLTTFTFYDIPAFLAPMEIRSFLFIDIPASFRQKKENSSSRLEGSLEPQDKLSE
jgi:hypothetical protein